MASLYSSRNKQRSTVAKSPTTTHIYHITDVSNLSAIIRAGGLFSDTALTNAGGPQTQIGYGHIKERRMTQYRIDCCDNRFVGEFVPFYFCPRSVMLYTVNMGNTGRQRGCQTSIVHLVSTVDTAIKLGRRWAISDGNAGAGHTTFSPLTSSLDNLDWSAIEANSWGGRTHQKAAEFLLADFFPWGAIHQIGCHNQATMAQVKSILPAGSQSPLVTTNPHWYYS